MKDLIIVPITIHTLATTPNKQLIIDEYAAECKCDAVPDCNPNFEAYARLEDIGLFDVLGVYHGEDLVGFAGSFTVELPKYSTLGTTVEFVFVLKDYRHSNVGIRLIRELERLARGRGSVSFFISAPVNGSLDKIAARALGLTKSQVVYSKGLL